MLGGEHAAHATVGLACYISRMDPTPNPDLAWYLAISKKHGLSPRCPFTSVERCPRYYQSLALLGEVGFTKMEPAEDESLLRKWKQSELWPRIAEQATAVIQGGLSNFCPEVTYDGYGYFASSIVRYSDEIDQDNAHRQLAAQNAGHHDWRWRWAGVRPMHFTECPLYSALQHQRISPHAPMDSTKQAYLEQKLGSMAEEAVTSALIAVNAAQGRATLAGALGNGRSYLTYNDAAFEVTKEVLTRMARLVYHATEGTSDAAAAVLDTAATKLVSDICDALDKKFRLAARAFGDKPLVDQLRTKLTKTREQIVEDFKHGMDGDVPLAKQQAGTIVNVTHSPSTQVAVGDRNVQTIHQQSTTFISVIDEVLKSDGFKQLNEDKAELVRTLADRVCEELRKPNADGSKVKSWSERMGSVLTAGGLVVEAAKLAAGLSDWLSLLGTSGGGVG